MTSEIGRNRNFNDNATVETYTISTTATTIAVPNEKRIAFFASLDSGTTNIDVFIRYYPAATDNAAKGYTLTRRTASNDALFWPHHVMTPDNIYPGEISAVTASGTVDIHVTEY